MSKKLSFLFCVVAGMFLCGVAAHDNNGQHILQQPGVLMMLLTGIACAFSGSLLLRTTDPRDWPGKGFAAMFVATSTGIAVLSGDTWLWAMNFALFLAITVWVTWHQVPPTHRTT